MRLESRTTLRLTTIAALIVLGVEPARAANLEAPTIAGWDRYVAATEARIGRELASATGFLLVDFQEPAQARADREALSAGDIVIAEMGTCDETGAPIPVPDGWVHHWRGSVFVPGANLDAMLAELADPERSAATAERPKDVFASRVLSREGNTLRVFLRLQTSGLISVTYDTEHRVRYDRLGPSTAASSSIATSIAEISEPGTPEEKARPPGEGRGLMWRINSYWRYARVPGGVLVECESLALSRAYPIIVSLIVGPIASKVARGSMEETLESILARFAGSAPAR